MEQEYRTQTPVEAAKDARLRYVSEEEPGIRRRRCGKGFTYLTPQGATLRDPAARERLRSLVIPPAWQDVWICADADGHIQATGRDEQGRKQYRYHPRWRTHRDVEKYRRLRDVGQRLPALRGRVGRLLALDGVERERVVAGAIRLLDRAALRVGSEAYAEENESYGITTLLKDHVRVRGTSVHLRFDAKGRVERDVTLRDAPLSRLVKRLEEIPGESLFLFRSENGIGNGGGAATQLRPEHVNDYLRETMACEVTAKDFRTWAGTVAVLRVLVAESEADQAERERVVLAAVDAAAERLGNLRATARQYYVHPGLIRAYEAGELGRMVAGVAGAADSGSGRGFRGGERLLLALLPELDDLLDAGD